MRGRLHRVVCATAVAALAADTNGVSVHGQGQPPIQTAPQPYDVPPELTSSIVDQSLYFEPGANGIAGIVEASPRLEQIDVRWFAPDGNPETSLVSIPLGYTPTAFCEMPTNWEFCIAGTTEQGHVKIERVKMERPVLAAGNGAIGIPTIESREVVFFSPRGAGLADVYHVTTNRADPDELFVEIHTPRLLYALDLTAHTVHLVASSDPSYGPALHSPLLSGKTNLFYSRDHQVHGHVYFLAELGRNKTIAVLRDVDRDGTLDDVLEWSEGNPQGLDDPALYND